MSSKKLIIGTRGSELALWQANFVKDQLAQYNVSCELHVIKTSGDQITNLSFDKMEGKGFFTKEIEDALLDKSIDLAVHSHKDLETTKPDGLCIAAVSEREDPSELMLIRKESVDTNQLWKLKTNAVVGTSSARRKSQLLHHRPDITTKDLRGNVPTRIKKLREKEYDAILIARAGVLRINSDTSEFENIILSPVEFIPAPAQGVLAIQCRNEDVDLITTLQKINHRDVQQLIGIERTVLQNMDGGCQLPLGVYAEQVDGDLVVHVAIANEWNSPLRRMTFIGEPGKEPELINTIVNNIRG